MAIDIALPNENDIVPADRSNYWRYYGLQHDPFTPYVKDNETLVFSRWEQYFDLLHYLCRSSNVLIAVTGIRGIGKTLFKNQFVSQLQVSTACISTVAEPALQPEKLLQILVEEFNLNPVEADSTEELLEAYAIQLQQAERVCVLIIDDAQRLPLSSLSILLSLVKLQSEAQMRLHIMLVGNQQLNDLLTQAITEESEQEIIHYLNLEPLSLDETQRYIKHRLTAAGLPAGIPLSTSTIERIHHLSEGVPGRINAVTRQVLIDAMQKPQLQALVGFIRANRSLIVGASMLAIVIVWLLASFAKHGTTPHWPTFGLSDYFQKNQEAVVTSETVSTANNVNSSLTAPADSTAANTSTVSTPSQFSTDSLPLITNHPATILSAESNDSLQAETSSTTNRVINDVAPVLVKEAVSKTINTKPKPQQLQSVNKPIETQSPAEKPVETKAVSEPLQPVMTKTKAKVTANQLPKANKNGVSDSVRQFLTANPQDFTLQLIGLSHESAMKAFIAEQKLKNHAIYYRGIRAGKEWFTLVYGIYSTKEAAQAAIKTLPSEVQTQKPWVRAIASVQHEIHQQIEQQKHPLS